MKKLFNKKNLVSLFIVFLMVSSVIGFMWGRSSIDTYDYKDYTFVRKENKYGLRTETGEILFDYFPTQVEDINLSEELVARITNTLEIDATSDPDSEMKEQIAITQFELKKAFNKIGTYFRIGFTTKNKYNLSIITCTDATEKVPVIHFKKGNETSIKLENKCIIAEGKETMDFARIKDRILYGYLGVING